MRSILAGADVLSIHHISIPSAVRDFFELEKERRQMSNLQT